jgi:hypothetical protein
MSAFFFRKKKWNHPGDTHRLSEQAIGLASVQTGCIIIEKLTDCRVEPLGSD